MTKDSRTYNVIRNVGSGILYKLISIFLPFILRTVMIHEMGIQYAGLNTLFSSILQVLNMTELGFGSALTFSMYKPIAENDNAKICALLNLYKRIYRFIGILILGMGLCVLPFIKYFIKGTYPDDINIYFLYLIYLFNTSISYFLYANMQALLNAKQRNDIINKIHSTTYFASYILQIIAIIITHNYYVYIILTPICTIVNNIISAICCNKLYPQIKCLGDISKEEKSNIYRKVKALFGHKIGAIVLISLDSIFVSSFLGLTAVGIYGNYFYILNAINGIIDIGYHAMLASIGNCIETENKERVYQLFDKLSFILAWIICICCVCFIGLYQPFMVLWAGKSNLFPFITVVFIVVYFYSQKSRVIIINFKDAAGLWNFDFWKPYIGILFSVGSKLILVNIMGIDGIFLSSILTFILIYLPMETYVIFRHLFQKSPKKYILKYIYYTIVTIIACVLSYRILEVVQGSGYISFIIKGLLCLTLACTIFLIFNISNSNLEKLKIDIKEKIFSSN